MNEEEQKTPPEQEVEKLQNVRRFEPIKCPVCGSTHLAFTEELRTSLGHLIIPALIAVYFFALIMQFSSKEAFMNLSETLSRIFSGGFMAFTVIMLILIAVVKLNIWNTERKSHAKAICRDCGHLWLLD